MKIFLATILFFLYSTLSVAQIDTIALYQKNEVDVNFLFNYYEQDGEHSAVTGGLGTEELKDISGDIIIHVVLDSLQELDFNVHLNQYTSASTDLIDSRMSSASAKDNRFSFNSAYTFSKSNWNWKHKYGAGLSVESDYVSTNLSAAFSRYSKNQMNFYEIGANIYFDKWVIIYPEEIRGTDRVYSKTDNRNSYQANFSFKRKLSKRINFSASVSPSFQQGILSTPFHRVYFLQDSLPKNEQLPDTRWRIPFGFRMNTYVNDYFVIRLAEGFYYDDFGILAFHSQIELPLKSGLDFMFFPFYRYYTQTQSDYFKAYKKHSNSAQYFTSDYDLSEFHSHKIGIGMRINPLYGIGGNKKTATYGFLKSIEMRLSIYLRSDDLSAFIVGSKFEF